MRKRVVQWLMHMVIMMQSGVEIPLGDGISIVVRLVSEDELPEPSSYPRRDADNGKALEIMGERPEREPERAKNAVT